MPTPSFARPWAEYSQGFDKKIIHVNSVGQQYIFSYQYCIMTLIYQNLVLKPQFQNQY